ncbi:hypothetical protein [Nioella aestuarii]|uniref:hypothetical protein n=1 Tax=Nioella aestuarii TaxID=1662864 RepID=UPI003D7F7512
MRIRLAAFALLLTAPAAFADQFIATFSNPSHPRNLNISITQLNSAGGTISTDNRRIARVSSDRSTWAVILDNSTARVCVTLRGNETATDATAMLSGGRTETVAITNNGRQMCPSADPGDIEILLVSFQ